MFRGSVLQLPALSPWDGAQWSIHPRQLADALRGMMNRYTDLAAGTDPEIDIDKGQPWTL